MKTRSFLRYKGFPMPLLSPLATVLTGFGQYPMEAQAPRTGLSHGRLLPRKSKTIITSWPPFASSQRPQPRATVAGNATRYFDAATSGGSDSKDTQRLCPRLTLDFSGWEPPFVVLLAAATPERVAPREGQRLWH